MSSHVKLAKINVYDFDYTIYGGDCSLDFYWFCLRRQPLIIRYLPTQVFHALLFLLKIESRTSFKSNFFAYLKDIHNVNEKVDDFWAGHRVKIKNWYKQTDFTQGVIVSASPEFLLLPMFEHIGMLDLIATRMDEKTGSIMGENCRGIEKVRRLQAAFPDAVIQAAYSDHASDAPLLQLAKKAYVVRGEELHQFTGK